MGRKKKYLTEEEKRNAHNIQLMNYYERNKIILQKKALARYYDLKELKNELSKNL
jgi:hypothetical protein